MYDKLKKIANEELDASVNKIIDACIDDFEIAEKVVIYRKSRRIQEILRKEVA